MKRPSRPLVLTIPVLVLVLLLAAACYPPAVPPAPTAAAPTAPANTITGIVWEWMSVSNKTTQQVETVPTPEDYTITFNTDGTLTGKADCNTFNGTYSQQNGLVITLGATTMMACGEGSWDQKYLQLLGSVVAGGPDGQGKLALENAGGEQRMLFENGGPAPE
jgi:heat shock protein HslJ